MKPVRLNEKEVAKYLEEGWWTKATYFDYWAENAGKWGDKEALIDTLGTRLTWAEAVQLATRVALAFSNELKLDRDCRVVLQLPNMVEHFLVRVACERASLVSIPLMVTYRHSEVKAIAKQTEAKAIVIVKEYHGFNHYQMAKDLQADLPALKHIIVVGKDVPADCVSLNQVLEHPYERECNLVELEDRKMDAVEDVAYLVTSTGTTGSPKIAERCIARDVWAAKQHIMNWQVTADDVILALAPVAGAPGGTPTYEVAPITGAKIALEYLPRDEETLRFIEKERVTCIALVPTQLARLLQLPVEKYDLSSLRFIRTSGGILPPALAKEAEERLKCPVLGTYGSRDAGSISGVPIWATEEQRYTTVGRPYPGTEVKVLDDDGRAVEWGEPGLLYFRGPGCTIGYYKDPEKTREVFDEDGWACPGDMVTITEDGFLRVVGRKKDAIIRGGQNIYPREVEDFLVAHPKVVEAAVVPMPDPEMGERACAFVTLKRGEIFVFEEMVDYLKSKKIARFKFPERLEVLEALPLAGGSKIDKKELTRLVTEKLKAEGRLVTPQ
ncbi:MAG TPA: o-succinylbenzoate--CoA ligase [Chloroflexi bacterium]|nr:o-succinylbenzoate--CoA ligase [Chloroflexota bacterium]